WFINSKKAYLKALNNAAIYSAPYLSYENPNARSYLWWNNYHPGTAIYRLLAEEVAGNVSGLWFLRES
ncbi:hypothetical protein NOF04DRAFT_1196609, partial [Fusarium oxysporum II5]